MSKFLEICDVFNSERIEKIFDDPKNIVVRATDAETLDGFSADFGYTYYPYPHTSVFRTPIVASNGILSRIQHRFHIHTIPKAYKNGMGKRHVAVLIYAAPGKELYFDVQWCDKVLGRVKVDNLDGRRHLLILKDSIVSEGDMEVLQIITDCKNICRIEYFAMLEELPESDLYIPRVSDLTASYINGGAVLDFLTQFAAKTSVKVEGSDGSVRDMEKDVFHTVHSYEFIAPKGKYTARIYAETAMGEKFTDEYQFEIKDLGQGIDVSIPLEILSPCVMPENSSLTFGVPIKKGTIYGVKSAELFENFVQTRVLSYWEDGSVKWLLCDCVLPSATKKDDVLKTTLKVFAGKPENTAKGATVGEYTVKAGQNFLPFGVYDKNGKEVVTPLKNAFEGMLGNGERLSCGACSGVITEEDGLYRTVLRYEVPLIDSDATAHFMNTVRVICDRRDDTVTLKHRLNVISPILEPALMGDKIKVDLSKFSAAAGALDGEKNEEPSIIRLKHMKINCGAGSFGSPEYDGKTYKSSLKVVAMSDLGYKIIADGKEQEQNGRAKGEFLGESGSFAVKNFWQLYPKSMELKNNMLSVGILPEIDFEFPQTDEDAWHRLYYCFKDGQYLLKTGIAPTTELVFSLNGGKRNSVLLSRCAVRSEINYLNSCDVFPYITPKNYDDFPVYEKWVDEGLGKLKTDRDTIRGYGFHNYGDWYGEGQYSWGNNEYDSPFCYLMEFLRGGDCEWFEFGVNAARHLADIDTVNFSLRKTDIGAQHIHIPGHCGGYLPPYFKNKGKGSRCKPSHAWLEGPFMYYALTGDESVIETLMKSAEWFCNFGIQNYDFHNCREAGWHLIHLCGAYRVSGARKYLNAAKIIAEKALSKQQKSEDGGWIRQLTSGHCACHKPHCFGEAGFMLALLIVGLGRYYDITKDERVKDSIVRGSRWLMRYTFDYEKGHFVYTNCPKMKEQFLTDNYTRHTTEPLAKAWELSGDQEIEDMLIRIKRCVGNVDESGLLMKGHYMGYGKCLCSDIRYTPLMIETFKKVADKKDANCE